jgi:molybdopterin-containing oxidoreductase family iron-sulfur binding subunit
MGIDRREFLKIGGLATAVGLAAPVLDSVLVKKLEASTTAGANSSAVRMGMVIDVTKLTTPKAYNDCIEACHSIHNVPDYGNKKDEIKWIWKTPFENAFPSKSHQFVSDEIKENPFLVMCNHCENPPCVRVCPTQATFKRDDGIVLMDYHRCIGCRFCMAACPYGSRSFNWRNPRLDVKTLVGGRKINKDFPTRERGVVEKCNFCAERLGMDPPKPPACVEASKGAMVYGNLNDSHSEIRKWLRRNNTIQRKAELGTNPSIFYIV